MNLKCETHPRKDATALCHHCGALLCEMLRLPGDSYARRGSLNKEQLCGFIIHDQAFASLPGEPGVSACHCEHCLVTQHPEHASTIQRLRSN